MKERGDHSAAGIHDTRQKIFKIIANSYYGISGQKSSIFYNLFVVLSVTSKGQSIISTAMSTFERFMGRTIKWRSLDEAATFISNILHEKDEFTITNIRNVTKKEVVEKILNEMQSPKKSYIKVIERLISNASQHKLNKLYYKNNFYKFIENDCILSLYKGIIDDEETEFLNPNEIPDRFVNNMEQIWFYTKEYAFYNYVTYNKIELLKHNPREVVLAVNLAA